VKGGERLEKDRFDRFYHLISCSSKSIQRLRSIGMTPYGLTGAHTMCLRHLYGNPDGLTRTKLTRLCDIDKAQVSRIINELCSKGYAIETENENINYRKRLKLTPMGKDTTEEINRLVLDLNGFVSADISIEELTVFYNTFEKICDRLKEAEDALEKRISETN
jgi:DNA-binding MarR family transcriptional regulator